MKRSISRAICFLIVFVIMNPVIAVLCRDPEDKPKHPFLKRYRKYMVVYTAEVVLMGNSMLDEAVSRRQFEYLTGKRTLKLAKGGSASAAWYLTLKNAVFNAPTTPKMVVILFRDLYLTSPKKRVHSKYKAYIDDLSTRHEPLLERLAFEREHTDWFLTSYVPAYRYRKRIIDGLNRKIKNDLVGKTVGLKTGGVHKAINRVFADNRLDKAQLTATQDAAESVEERDAFEFQPNLKKSFLPHIIELALDAEARLVFVRVKKRRDLEPGKEPEKLKRYISEMSAYLKNQETPLIDFTHDPRLVEAHFGVGDHLNRTSGRRLFTSMLAEALRPLFDISPYGKR